MRQWMKAKARPGVVPAVGLVLAALLALPLVAPAQEQMRLDDWSRTYKPNENAPTWGSRKFAPIFGNGETYFYQFVHDRADQHYLHVKSGRNNSFSVGKEFEFQMPDYPVLSWDWRVTTLPEGGDVRVEARDDQAGAVCVVENPGLMGYSSLCYIYENEGPIDEVLTSKKNESAKYLILRTKAADGTGTWFSERRNILADFKRAFGRDPQDEAIVGTQIDSNDTGTSAEAFYRNMVLHRQ